MRTAIICRVSLPLTLPPSDLISSLLFCPPPLVSCPRFLPLLCLCLSLSLFSLSLSLFLPPSPTCIGTATGNDAACHGACHVQLARALTCLLQIPISQRPFHHCVQQGKCPVRGVAPRQWFCPMFCMCHALSGAQGTRACCLTISALQFFFLIFGRRPCRLIQRPFPRCRGSLFSETLSR